MRLFDSVCLCYLNKAGKDGTILAFGLRLSVGIIVFIFDNTNDFSDLSAKKERGDGASQKSDYIGATFQQIS